jgi:hypothetical protein
MKKLILILFVGLVAFSTVESKAQVGILESPYGFSTDTLTLAAATGTIFLTTDLIKAAPATSTTVEFKVVRLSGTTAGTATLQGSMDGTNWNAMTTPNTATALATYTVANSASAFYAWSISGSPYPYLRVSWTATTATFSAIISAKFYRAK